MSSIQALSHEGSFLELCGWSPSQCHMQWWLLPPSLCQAHELSRGPGGIKPEGILYPIWSQSEWNSRVAAVSLGSLASFCLGPGDLTGSGSSL